jgi:hypothetical protein
MKSVEIEFGPALAELDPLPEELEAVRIMWRERGELEGEIPEEAAIALLGEVRARRELIERHVVEGLIRRIKEGRRYPRRHMRFVVIVVMGLVAGISILILAVELLRRFL